MFKATMIWLASLVMFPAPTSPVSTTDPAIVFMRSWHLSKISFLPPTITERVPSMAFGSPPLTGASSSSTPFSASRAAISRLTSGAIELISMTIIPGRAASMIPPSPSTTSFTWGELGNMVIMMSACSATDFGLFAAVAPAATTSSANAFILSITTSW